MISWVNKDTEIYCSFAKTAGNTGCQMMNTAFYYYGLNKIYKSFSVDSIEDAVRSVKTLNIKGFAVTMPFKQDVLKHVDEICDSAKIGAANTVVNENNKLKAYNTDYLASLDYLRKFQHHDNFYIIGDGGYSVAVKAAARKLNMDYDNITRSEWTRLHDIENGLIYNCTPVEDLGAILSDSNILIDCIVKTDTGKQLAKIQASYQFELYTGLKFPL
jgi:shikimate dehydrogenase